MPPVAMSESGTASSGIRFLRDRLSVHGEEAAVIACQNTILTAFFQPPYDPTSTVAKRQDDVAIS